MTTSYLKVENTICSEKDPPPQLIVIVEDNNSGTLGYLVIDSFGKKCSGGIRMAHDISLDEVAKLARAMTLKWAFNNTDTGGAKAGIICPIDANDKEKEEILKLFGQKLGPIMRTIYAPGGDLGIGPKEIAIIKRAAGLETKVRPATYKSGYFTAYGVFVSARTVMKELGLRFDDCSFAIEGYGNVGRPLAKFLYQAGSKIIAVSTVDGAIFNQNGLDITKLDGLANKYGDKVVKAFKDGDQIKKADLFTLDANIVIPGARAWSINIDNVYEVKANAIVPASNIPVTKEASEVLYTRGITYLPDFVSTAGGLMGSGLLNRGYQEKDVLAIMDKAFEAKVSRLMKISRQTKTDINKTAIKISNDNFIRLRNNAILKKNKIKWVTKKVKEEKSIIPIFGRIAAYLYERFNGRGLFSNNIIRSLAVENAIRNAVSIVEYYPTVALDHHPTSIPPLC